MADETKSLSNLDLLKANIGVTGTARDNYLNAILDSVSHELTVDKGVDITDLTGQMFMVDYAAWRWKNRGEGVMPRNLQYRLHNLMIRSKPESNSEVSADE